MTPAILARISVSCSASVKNPCGCLAAGGDCGGLAASRPGSLRLSVRGDEELCRRAELVRLHFGGRGRQEPFRRLGTSSRGRSGDPETVLARGNGFSFGADDNLIVWKPFLVRQATGSVNNARPYYEIDDRKIIKSIFAKSPNSPCVPGSSI